MINNMVEDKFTIVEEATPTTELRWFGPEGTTRTLQQKWLITMHREGSMVVRLPDQRFEWRDVPLVLG